MFTSGVSAQSGIMPGTSLYIPATIQNIVGLLDSLAAKLDKSTNQTVSGQIGFSDTTGFVVIIAYSGDRIDVIDSVFVDPYLEAVYFKVSGYADIDSLWGLDTLSTAVIKALITYTDEIKAATNNRVVNFPDTFRVDVIDALNSEVVVVVDSIVAPYTTASRVAYFNANNILVAHANVSDTELGYLDLATSNIQAQLDSKLSLGAIEDTLANKHTHIVVDSMTLKGQTKPFLPVWFGDWVSYPDYDPANADSVEISAPLDSIDGGLFASVHGSHPDDTSSVLNTIDIYVQRQVKEGYVSIDSVSGYVKTGNASTDTNYAKIEIWQYEPNGGVLTLRDSTTILANTSWTHFALSDAALSNITRWEFFWIRVKLASRAVTQYAWVSRMKIYWKEGS